MKKKTIVIPIKKNVKVNTSEHSVVHQLKQDLQDLDDLLSYSLKDHLSPKTEYHER